MQEAEERKAAKEQKKRKQPEDRQKTLLKPTKPVGKMFVCDCDIQHINDRMVADVRQVTNEMNAAKLYKESDQELTQHELENYRELMIELGNEKACIRLQADEEVAILKKKRKIENREPVPDVSAVVVNVAVDDSDYDSENDTDYDIEVEVVEGNDAASATVEESKQLADEEANSAIDTVEDMNSHKMARFLLSQNCTSLCHMKKNVDHPAR